jgi:hypothetical protein
MQSIVAYLTADAIVNEASTLRTRSRKPGFITRARRSVTRRFRSPAAVDRTESQQDRPTSEARFAAR